MKVLAETFYFMQRVGGCCRNWSAVWPLINQMNPSADVKALASIRVDVSEVEPGTQLTVKWLGKPVFIRRRTEAEIEEAKNVNLDELLDNMARNDNIPEASADDTNRSLDESGEWLVMMGVCTHLGCVPLGDGAGELTDGFAHVMVPTTTLRVEYVKVQHQKI